jgi:DNA mismatch repair protein MutS2
VRSEESRVKSLREEYDSKLREVKAEAKVGAERLRAEEERFLREKRREIENLVRQIKEQKASHESVVAAKQHVEQALAEVEAEEEARGERREARGESPELKTGDNVESHTFRRQGVVVETSENRATVAFGQIRVELAVDDLRLVEPAEARDEKREAGVESREESYSFDTRLNVRGMTREEADEAVTKFLDEARMTGSVELTIVHGKGGGVLRRSLWDRLRRDSGVATVSLAEAAAGGSGVTVVKLIEARDEKREARGERRG